MIYDFLLIDRLILKNRLVETSWPMLQQQGFLYEKDAGRQELPRFMTGKLGIIQTIKNNLYGYNLTGFSKVIKMALSGNSARMRDLFIK